MQKHALKKNAVGDQVKFIKKVAPVKTSGNTQKDKDSTNPKKLGLRCVPMDGG